MNFADVRACLEKDGWPVEVVSETTLRSRFRGGDRIFPVFVHLEPAYVTFAIIPFAHLPEEDELCADVAEHLLRLNREMNMAKFSADEDGDVVLSVEYRIENLDPSEVRDALDVLSFYAEKYREDIARVSGQASA
ncbi:MAG: YbjN domain-containing protein [Byssovorax sp.]